MACQRVISCYFCDVPIMCHGEKGMLSCDSCDQEYDGSPRTKYAICFLCSCLSLESNLPREIERIREAGRNVT